MDGSNGIEEYSDDAKRPRPLFPLMLDGEIGSISCDTAYDPPEDLVVTVGIIRQRPEEQNGSKYSRPYESVSSDHDGLHLRIGQLYIVLQWSLLPRLVG